MTKEETKDKEVLNNILKYIEIIANNTENLKNQVTLLSQENNIKQQRKNVQQQMKKSQEAENCFVNREIKKNNSNNDISTISI